mmetsp:Transcript_78778/g.202932  ORF Transcript_78778/g.202932 Transcript_78778/m.202932 type:complete len:395 (+) Transcript_78778:146-1330(+)
MAAVLKVQCEGEIRRLLCETTPDFEGVRSALEQLWPGCSTSKAKYQDEEGDACVLTEASFADFLGTSGAASTPAGRLVLRLHVSMLAVRSDVQPAVIPQALPEAGPSETVQNNEVPSSAALQTQTEASEYAAPKEPRSPTAHITSVQEPVCDSSPESAAKADGSLAAATATPASSEAAAEAQEAEEPSAALVVEPALGEALGGSGAAGPVSVAGPAVEGVSHETPEEETPLVTGTQAPEGEGDISAAGEPTLSEQEKVQIVIAAFDENKDGHLNLDECNNLLYGTWGWRMPTFAYQRLCTQVGAQPEVGLDAEALTNLYAHSRTLDFDYEVAKRKLEGNTSASASRPDSEPCPWYVPLAASGAVLAVPLLAVPLAAIAASRTWRWAHHRHGAHQ